MIRVLFVCLGNICRSPMAEAVFRHKVREQTARSRMRRAAGVPVARSRRVGLDLLLQPSRAHFMPEHRLGHRRAADVAEANEQNANHTASFLFRGLKTRV